MPQQSPAEMHPEIASAGAPCHPARCSARVVTCICTPNCTCTPPMSPATAPMWCQKDLQRCNALSPRASSPAGASAPKSAVCFTSMKSIRQAPPKTPAATNAGTGPREAKHKREAGSGAGIKAWRTLVASRTNDLRTLGQSVYEDIPMSLSLATVALRLRAQLGAPRRTPSIFARWTRSNLKFRFTSALSPISHGPILECGS